MKLQSFFFIVASLISVAMSGSIASVINDFESIGAELNNIDGLVNHFRGNGVTLGIALAIHAKIRHLTFSIDQGTNDVNAYGAFSEEEGTTILHIIQGFEPNILGFLSGIIAIKPDFVALKTGGIPALVKQDLTLLNTSRTALEAAFINAAPPDVISGEDNVKHSLDGAYAAAISAYA